MYGLAHPVFARPGSACSDSALRRWRFVNAFLGWAVSRPTAGASHQKCGRDICSPFSLTSLCLRARPDAPPRTVHGKLAAVFCQLKGAGPVAMAHTMAHLAAVVSIGAGAVGFVQVGCGCAVCHRCLPSGSYSPWCGGWSTRRRL